MQEMKKANDIFLTFFFFFCQMSIFTVNLYLINRAQHDEIRNKFRMKSSALPQMKSNPSYLPTKSDFITK